MQLLLAGKCGRGGTGSSKVAAALVRMTQIEPRAGVVVVHRDDAQVNTRGGGGAARLSKESQASWG